MVTGRIDLGAANIFIALAIATTKATLVVLFFMHLWDEGGVNRLVFVVSVIRARAHGGRVRGSADPAAAALPNGGPVGPIGCAVRRSTRLRTASS